MQRRFAAPPADGHTGEVESRGLNRPSSQPASEPSRSTAPLRGTQSLVGVLTFVFRHPALTLLELLWRWLAAAPLLGLAWHSLAPAFRAIPLNNAALDSMTFFEPVRSVAVLVHQFAPFRAPLVATATWWVPLALLVWTAMSTLGRTAVLLRADPSLRPQPGSMAVTNLLRAAAFGLVLFLWFRAVGSAVYLTVVGPGRTGGEPNLVLLTAVMVVTTLVLFLAWSLTVWALDLLPLRRMAGLQVTRAQRKQLRAKLIETNLVMGIVRVILLVLALTFSASPLPFQTRETQAFINVWWVGVAVFYILSSDLFHVVRRVTYLRLLQSIAGTANAASSIAS